MRRYPINQLCCCLLTSGAKSPLCAFFPFIQTRLERNSWVHKNLLFLYSGKLLGLVPYGNYDHMAPRCLTPGSAKLITIVEIRHAGSFLYLWNISQSPPKYCSNSMSRNEQVCSKYPDATRELVVTSSIRYNFPESILCVSQSQSTLS